MKIKNDVETLAWTESHVCKSIHGISCTYRPDFLYANWIMDQLLTQTLRCPFSELGTSLFEIAQSLFALERTLILGAMALLNKKSEAQ